jgi:hypothetical protein
MVLDALAQAAAAAAAAAATTAAGEHLRLHTLRVLGLRINLSVTSGLLAGLPQLTTLQLCVERPDVSAQAPDEQYMVQWVQEQLEPVALKPATQLRSLCLEGPGGGPWVCGGACAMLARLLPTSLARLSWSNADYMGVPNLSHLTQLSFLHLNGWHTDGLSGSSSSSNSNSNSNSSSSRLPPCLEELRLHRGIVRREVVEAQQRVLVGLEWQNSNNVDDLPLTTRERLTKLRVTALRLRELKQTGVAAALQQLRELGTLTVGLEGSPSQPADMQVVVCTASGIPSLRHLHLKELLSGTSPMPGLHALTGLTRVTLSALKQVPLGYASELGQMPGLKQLSVPETLLLEAPGPWPGGMRQLRVLMAHGGPVWRLWGPGVPLGNLPVPSTFAALEPGMPLPPQLLVMGWAGVLAESEAAQPLREQLEQRLSSSGCELVVGVDLDEVCDPVKQLAGVPEALQQALA